MATYYIALALLLFLGLIAREYCLYEKNSARVNLAIAGIGCIALGVLAALRAPSVGADTQQYVDIFNWVKTLQFYQLPQDNVYAWWGSSIECTYKVYNWLLSRLSMSEQAITIANSLVLMLALFRFVRNESPNAWMSVFLFFTLGMYQLALNLTPSSIAALIALGSYRYVRERRAVAYMAWVLVASCFHMSAFIFIVLYFIHKIQLDRKQFLCLLIGGVAFALLLAQPILRVLSSMAPDAYQSYLSTGSVRLEQLFVLVAYAILVSMSLLSSRSEVLFRDQNNDVRWMLLIVGVLYAFAASSTGITRVAFLFAPFIIVVVPRLMYDGQISNRFTGIAKNARVKRPSEAWMLSVVAVSVFLYIARVSINNIGTTIPYLVFLS